MIRFHQINKLLEKWMFAKKTITEMPNLFARKLQTNLEIQPTYNVQEEEHGNLVLVSCFLWFKKDAISHIDNIHLVIILKLI